MTLKNAVVICTSIYLEEIRKTVKNFAQNGRCAGGWTDGRTGSNCCLLARFFLRITQTVDRTTYRPISPSLLVQAATSSVHNNDAVRFEFQTTLLLPQ
jgi:hypothetical protein